MASKLVWAVIGLGNWLGPNTQRFVLIELCGRDGENGRDIDDDLSERIVYGVANVLDEDFERDKWVVN